MSDAIDQFRETQEHHTEGTHGPRWIPIAAAALAVLAAIFGFLGNLRATASLTAKNDAVIATTHATDVWNQYQADSIKQHVYEAVRDGGRAVDPAKIERVIRDESAKKPPLAARAKSFEQVAEAANERSEHLLFEHEAFEIATALFEVAIVLVSITALVRSRILPALASVALVLGLSAAIVALVR